MLTLETLTTWRGTPVTVYPPTYIHESAVIGEGTKIGAFGNIDKDVTIGKNCCIQAHSKIHTGSKIGDNVFLGPDVTLLNDLYPMSLRLSPVVIEDNSIIGGGCVINPRVRIGENTVICSHSLVTKHIPKNEVWLGNPAKYHCSIDEYISKRTNYEGEQK